MKKLTTIMIVMVLSSVTWAQNDAISKFFSKYNDDPEFTQVSVTSKMFGLFTHFEPEDEDEEAVKNAISKLTGLKILVLEDTQRGKDLYDEAFSLRTDVNEGTRWRIEVHDQRKKWDNC